MLRVCVSVYSLVCGVWPLLRARTRTRHGDDGGPCLLSPCRANLSLSRSLGSNPLYKSLVKLRSYCWMGIEKPLSLPNGLVPVGTDMGCIPGFAE